MRRPVGPAILGPFGAQRVTRPHRCRRSLGDHPPAHGSQAIGSQAAGCQVAWTWLSGLVIRLWITGVPGSY
jgi:hypothetical protein